MTRDAQEAVEVAKGALLVRQDAKRIFQCVEEACDSPELTGPRWPFELLQNALDAGPRAGRNAVRVAVTWLDGDLLFEHDGEAFSPADLAALLSGGSNKEVDSDETVGRFGTGFLSAHVLSTSVEMEGLLITAAGVELFRLLVDRSGDVDAIIQNIAACNEALASATPLDPWDETPSARFVYRGANDAAAAAGIATLRSTLPYVFATCPKLGRFEITSAEGVEEWRAGPTALLPDAGIERVIERHGDTPGVYRALRYVDEGTPSAAIVALGLQVADKWALVTLEDHAPRLFWKFPILPSHFAHLNFIVDGNFKLARERNRVRLTQTNCETAQRALGVAPRLIQRVFSEDWSSKHLIARVGHNGGVDTDPDSADWWPNVLKTLAGTLSTMPLVETPRGFGPAIKTGDGDWYADFPAAWVVRSRILEDAGIERYWHVFNDVDKRIPPIRSLVTDWAVMTEEWKRLGIPVDFVDLTSLVEDVLPGSNHIDDLIVECDHIAWVARFVDLVGELRAHGERVDLAVLDDLLPDQNGILSKASQVRRDDGIPERLKNLAFTIGFDARALLLDERLRSAAEAFGLPHLRSTLDSAVTSSMSVADVIQQCVSLLTAAMKDGAVLSEQGKKFLDPSILLLEFLWETQGVAGAEHAKRVPLVDVEEKAHVWTRDRTMMAPPDCWPPEARPFASVYPEGRVIASSYAGSEDTPNVVPSLAAWGMAFADPIFSSASVEAKERRLGAMLVDAVKHDGAVLGGIEMSQIALQQEIFNRCSESPEKAQLLFGLVLCFVARRDPRWREIVEVSARQAGTDLALRVRPSVWLADLKWRAWVPVESDGKFTGTQATPATLEPLLKPEWLSSNEEAIELLGTCFGFDALELRLLGAAPDRIKRQEIRDSLALVVEYARGDAGMIADIVKRVENAQAKAALVSQLQSFGYAVQDAVQRILVDAGLGVKVIDHGYDFEVTADGSPPLDRFTKRLKVGTWWIEVKATTTGEVRLTPLQAETSTRETDRFALCVVDLRGVLVADLDREWSAAEVEPRARVVEGVGTVVETPWNLVQAARVSSVAIRNDGNLRYAVPAALWVGGESLADWILRIVSNEAETSASDDIVPPAAG